MGVNDLRKSFNAVAEPGYICTMALMDTHRSHDVEASVLTFLGTKENGEQFTISSRPVRNGEDVNSVAAETAKRLIEGTT